MTHEVDKMITMTARNIFYGLVLLALVFALPTIAAIEGHITDVWWGDSNIHPTATITP